MAITKGITIRFGADSTEVTKALRQINTETKSINKELNAVDKALKLDPSNTVLLQQKQKLLAESVSETSKKMQLLTENQEKAEKAFKNNEAWEQAYKPLQQNIDTTKSKLKELLSQQDKMQKQFESGKINADEFNAYQAEITETRNAIKELNQQKKDLDKQFADGHMNEEEYRAYCREVENTRNQLTRLEQEQRQVNTALVGGTASVNSYKDSLNALNTSANKLGSDLANIGRIAVQALTAVGGAAVAGIGKATSVGSEFEASMSKVQAISGATAEEFNALAVEAERMGASTSKTASESASALGYMALAGWDTQQMLTGLEPILRASEAGGMDLARCSDLVTDSMSAMGVSVDDLNHYLDVCTTAQSNANTSLEGLLEAYVGCGGTLRNLNVSTEESAAVLGILANRGIKASEAGTALNSILVNLVGANKSAASAMEALGVSAWDENGKFIGLSETLKLLSGALENCTDKQKALFEAKIGGKTQMDTLQALISGVTDEYDDLYDTLQLCDGALLDTAKTMQDNLMGDVTALGSGLEGLGISVYKHFEEPFRDAVQTAIDQISKLNENCSEGELAGILERLAKQLGELAKQAAEFAADEGIPKLIKFLDWLSQHGSDVINIIKGIGAGWVTWQAGKIASDVSGLVVSMKEFSASAATATVEQKALNAAQKANIYALIATLLISAATALAGYIDKLGDARMELAKYNSELEQNYLDIQAQRDAFENQKKALDDNLKAVDDNTDSIKRRWNQLQNMVDEEGNVIANEKDVQKVLDELNTLMDSNITIIGGQIQGYKDLKSSLDDYIESLRTRAKLEYYYDDYKAAVAGIDEQKQASYDLAHSYTEAYTKARQFRKESEEMYKVLAQHGTDPNKVQSMYYDNFLADNGIALDNNKDFTAFVAMVNQGRTDIKKADYAKYYADFLDYEAQLIMNNMVMQNKNVKELQSTIDDYEEQIKEYEKDSFEASEELNNALGIDTGSTDNGVPQKNDDDEDTSEDELKKLEKQEKAKVTAKKKALQHMLKVNDQYTEEMYYNDLEAFAETLDKQTTAYADLMDYIEEGRKKLSDNAVKDADKTAKEIATKTKKELSDLEKSINSVVTKYNKKLTEITNNVSALEKELNKTVSIFGSDTTASGIDALNTKLKEGNISLEEYNSQVAEIKKQEELSSKSDGQLFSMLKDNKLSVEDYKKYTAINRNSKSNKKDGLADLDKQGKELDTFMAKLDKLREKGVSENILAEIIGKGTTGGSDAADSLLGMSDDKLKAYSKKYDDLLTKNKEFSEKYYADSIESLNKNFVEEISAQFTNLPKELQDIGVETIASLIAGMDAKRSDLISYIGEYCSGIITELTKGLESGNVSVEAVVSSKTEDVKPTQNAAPTQNTVNSTDAIVEKLISKDSKLSQPSGMTESELRTLVTEVVQSIDLTAITPELPTNASETLSTTAPTINYEAGDIYINLGDNADKKSAEDIADAVDKAVTQKMSDFMVKIKNMFM